MARVNIYLPDDLAERARESGLNISALTRSALEDELARAAGDAWLAQVVALPPTGVSHDDVVAAIDATRDEFGDFGQT